jgi:hypothetical protein
MSSFCACHFALRFKKLRGSLLCKLVGFHSSVAEESIFIGYDTVSLIKILKDNMLKDKYKKKKEANCRKHLTSELSRTFY